MTFAAFCAMASAVYILNDLVDVETDRAHPIKCKRPIASREISPYHAKILLVALFLASVGLSISVSIYVAACTISYFIINIFYSLSLKHVVILDVFLISSGFMLRILAGTLGLGIAPSAWLLLCGLMITLFMGFSKRRAELLMLKGGDKQDQALTRRVLDDYSPIILEQYIAITAAGTILSYGLYTVSPKTIQLHNTENLILTLPFVMYGIFRYIFLLHRCSRGNDTAKDLLQDPHLLMTVILWFACTLWILQ
ncbi:decaprenyl-phosphate phosphoribosyltransferase [Advenella faeciporci]|uniref:Decaprenyl-phosphate phosphoribosyltransferase n=2 Tax=Advenella faeciporci TaxID=797535 RepID=A0A918JP12_9BURK|nr:decaprenyl-phosphate phosphoribosyltransferase [Advenella faeciporci]